jgi:hypothetical protein
MEVLIMQEQQQEEPLELVDMISIPLIIEEGTARQLALKLVVEQEE